MEGLKRLVLEIHRRSVWQVLGAYLILTWLVFETFEVLSVAIGLPEWVEPTAGVILIVGLPAVLATASIQRKRPDEPAATSAAGAAGDGPEPQPVVRTEGLPSMEDAAVAHAKILERRQLKKPRELRDLLTWQNTLVGGFAAFGLLALVTVGYMLMRSYGIGPAGTLVAQGTLAEAERVILADFDSPPELNELAQVITEGFRVDLSQSPVVRMYDQRYVSAALVRMEETADARLDIPLAREVAQREAVRAVIGGDIYSVGSKYVLTARLVAAEDGALLVSRRVTARDEAGIVQAVDELSKKMRERIGEPLNSIYMAQPLEKVTTGNLEALRKYTQAVHAIDIEGDPDRGIRLLEEAVELDPSFAMSWRKLGVALGNRSEERARAVEALQATMEHRDRLTPRERFLATAAYYSNVEGDHAASIAQYDSLLQLNPEDDWALNNSGNIYLQLRDYPRAEDFFVRALAVDSFQVIPFMNLVLALANQNEQEAADKKFGEFAMWLAPDPSLQEHVAYLPTAEGDFGRTAARLRALHEDYPSSLFWKAQTSYGLAAVAATQGKLSESEQHFRDAMDTDIRRGLPQQAVVKATRLAELDLWVRQDIAAAIRTLEAVLAEYPMEDMSPLDRPSLQVAQIYAAAGRVPQAKAMLAQFEADVDPAVRGPDERVAMARLEGAIAIAEGRGQDAVTATEESDQGFCNVCALPQLARAQETAGDIESAIATYEQYLNTPYLWRVRDSDGAHLGPTYERLARLYEQQGDTANAARNYREFVSLWAAADEELQGRVAAARQRMEALQ
jgi:tetratricopeptide (TPR) repeat protein/TolB-like protein